MPDGTFGGYGADRKFMFYLDAELLPNQTELNHPDDNGTLWLVYHGWNNDAPETLMPLYLDTTNWLWRPIGNDIVLGQPGDFTGSLSTSYQTVSGTDLVIPNSIDGWTIDVGFTAVQFRHDQASQNRDIIAGVRDTTSPGADHDVGMLGNVTQWQGGNGFGGWVELYAASGSNNPHARVRSNVAGDGGFIYGMRVIGRVRNMGVAPS